MSQLKRTALIHAIDALTGDDPEADHGVVDRLLLEYVGGDVRKAVDRLVERAGWWASA